MNYSKEQLEKLGELTKALTPIDDMALLLGVPKHSLMFDINDETTRVHEVYFRTKAEKDLEIRRLNIELAEAGSPAAAEMVNTYSKQMYDGE